MSTKEDLDSHLAIIEQTTANPVHLSDVSEKAPGFNATANETTDTPQYPGRVRLVFLVFGLVLSSFLIGLDNTIISSAIPKITDQFHALEDVGWYGSALLLTTCAFQLAWGKLYTFYPVKLTYLTALFVFEIGSLICAVAPTSVALIIGRAIAGVGTGGASAGGYLLVALSVPERQRPTLVGLIGSMYGVSTVAGPLLGGLFTDSPRLTWRWCFYINLPLGAIAAVIILLCGPSSRVRGDPGRPASLLGQLRLMDLPGTLALVPGVICFLLALQWGGAKYAWTNGRIIALLVVAVCLFVAFIAIQIRSGERATVPPRIFANRNIWGSAIFGACLTACFFVMVYYLPLWFQAIKGASAAKSGIMNLPMVLGFVVFTTISGALVSAIGYYIQFVYLSLILMALGTGLLSTLTVDAGLGPWIGYQVLLGAGVGVGLQAPITAAQTALQLKDIATGTAAVIFCETLVGAVMVSVAQNVFANQLVRGLSGVPGLDPRIILENGATELKGRVAPEAYPAVLAAYNRALTRTFYVGVGLACCSLVGAVWLEPLRVGRKGKAEGDGDGQSDRE